MVAVTRTGDLVAVHKLVDLLDDHDRTVRMYAILGLRRLCGEDFGYRYYAVSAERAPAVARWRETLRAGTLTVGQQRASSDDAAGREGGAESRQREIEVETP